MYGKLKASDQRNLNTSVASECILQSFAVKQGWGIGKFCVAWGWAFANPEATLELLNCVFIHIQT